MCVVVSMAIKNGGLYIWMVVSLSLSELGSTNGVVENMGVVQMGFCIFGLLQICRLYTRGCAWGLYKSGCTNLG